MHERSLVKALINQVVDLATLEKNCHVTEVCVRLGPLSGVEPLLLASAFDDLSPGTMIKDARLSIHEVELSALCKLCGQRFVVVAFIFRCTHCGATDVNVTDGDGVWLESITLAQAEVSV